MRKQPAGSLTKMSFLEAVHERVVVYDGAIGTNLHRREPTIDDYGGAAYEGCVDLLSLTRPDFVTDLHESFFEVGADIVETNTFGAFGTVSRGVRPSGPCARDVPGRCSPRGPGPRRLRH